MWFIGLLANGGTERKNDLRTTRHTNMDETNTDDDAPCGKPHSGRAGTRRYEGPNGNEVELCQRHYYEQVTGDTVIETPGSHVLLDEASSYAGQRRPRRRPGSNALTTETEPGVSQGGGGAVDIADGTIDDDGG